MKIQNITPQLQQNNNTHKKDTQPQFGGGMDVLTGALRWLETNQAWGANATDLGAMTIPRTWTDARERGMQAGTETFIRESSGTLNHSLVGVYGTVAGLALAAAFNNKFGINAHKIFADNNAIDFMADSLNNIIQSHKELGHEITVKDGSLTRLNPKIKEEYAKAVTEQISTFNDGFKKIENPSDKIKVQQTIVEMMEDAENLKGKKLSKTIKKQAASLVNEKVDYLTNLITESTGGMAAAQLQHNQKTSTGPLKTTLQNIINVSRTFVQDNVIEEFKNTKNLKENVYIHGLKTLNLKRSAFGLGFAAMFGMTVQPVNRWFTKKRTGSDGFVGVQGRKKDKSASFKVQKAITGLALGVGALATITTKPSKLLSKLQFKGMTPTINQLKFVYGMTIMSRLFAARDKDELRESAIKDTLGFLNLLVLGSLVTKAVVMLLDKSKTLMNTAQEGGHVFKRFINSSVRTKDEVLINGLKKHGISTISADGKALPFSKLMKLLPKSDKAVRKQLRILNCAQLIGYAYSAIVLGRGIPMLNIYMTNKREARNAAKLAANAPVNTEKNNINNDFLKSKMVNFYGNR